jgi:hypothetical protein
MLGKLAHFADELMSREFRSRHCEERSDEAIQQAVPQHWIASLRSQ